MPREVLDKLTALTGALLRCSLLALNTLFKSMVLFPLFFVLLQDGSELVQLVVRLPSALVLTCLPERCDQQLQHSGAIELTFVKI